MHFCSGIGVSFWISVRLPGGAAAAIAAAAPGPHFE